MDKYKPRIENTRYSEKGKKKKKLVANVRFKEIEDDRRNIHLKQFYKKIKAPTKYSNKTRRIKNQNSVTVHESTEMIKIWKKNYSTILFEDDAEELREVET